MTPPSVRSAAAAKHGAAISLCVVALLAGGLLFTAGLLVFTLAFVPAAAFLPVTAALGGLVGALYRLIPEAEDKFPLKKEVTDKDGKVLMESRLRNTTGWFSDLSKIQPSLPTTLTFPLQFWKK